MNRAQSYTDEHFDEKGAYEIIAHKEDDGVLKAQICSCHTSNKTYIVWVEYTQGLNPITGWYFGMQKWCSNPWVLCACGFSALVFRILPQQNRK